MEKRRMWTLSDKDAFFERSIIQTFPNARMLAKAVTEKFLVEVQLYGGSATCLERVWRNGRIAIRYRLRSVTQEVEVLSVAEAESGAVE